MSAAVEVADLSDCARALYRYLRRRGGRADREWLQAEFVGRRGYRDPEFERALKRLEDAGAIKTRKVKTVLVETTP